MKQDGELRLIFRRVFPTAQWTSVETGLTAGGVPDSEFCFPGGQQGWIEFKRTDAWAVRLRPAQVGWTERRVRLGGRVLIAVRRMCRGEDELHLLPGKAVCDLQDKGLRGAEHLGTWAGGPSRWNWKEVGAFLVQVYN
jgi:hypothetical protein